jgi:hypothetical protein
MRAELYGELLVEQAATAATMRKARAMRQAIGRTPAMQ